MIAFDVVGKPVSQGSKVPGRTKAGRLFVRESARGLPAWRNRVATVAQDHAPAQPIEGPIRLDLRFRLPVPKSAPKRRRLAHTKKPDSLKLGRAVEDALAGIFYRSDSQIVEHRIVKEYAYEQPIGVRVRIEEVEQ